MSFTTTLAMPSAHLVFGVRWYVLLGGNGEQLARRYARQARATHAVVLGQPAALVGVASPGSLRPAGGHHCAAANIARLHPSGTHVVIMPVPTHGWWFVAVHEGLPVARTDRFFAAREEALIAVQELRQAYPQLQILGEAGAAPLPTLADIEAAGNPASMLKPVSRLAMQSLLLWGLVCALLLGAWGYGYSRVRPSGPSVPQLSVDLHDAGQAWRRQLHRSLEGVLVHGVPGTQQLLASVAEMPVQIGGWLLVRIACQPVHAAWSCQADYRRTARGADAGQLLDRALQGWRIRFPSLDAAVVQWQTSPRAMALALVRVPEGAESARVWLSGLQKLKAAFISLEVEPVVPLVVVPPQAVDGQVLARPADLPVYSARKLHVKGPLRSVALLLPHSRFMFWRSFVLNVSPNPSPSVRASALMAELQGVFYEKSP